MCLAALEPEQLWAMNVRVRTQVTSRLLDDNNDIDLSQAGLAVKKPNQETLLGDRRPCWQYPYP